MTPPSRARATPSPASIGLRLQRNTPDELGATLHPDRIDFALAAPHASRVELCLFDAGGRHETARLPLPDCTAGIWHGSLPRSEGIGEGLIYGWRVHGPWAPHAGPRYNPAKLLLDPYAREVVGHYDGSPLHLGQHFDADGQLAPDPRDNAAAALKARVVADLPPLSQPRPRVDPAQRVIYELHVKGFTALHPDIPPPLRGSYAGLAHPAAIAHLQRLGVTTVSILPLAFRADEARLLGQGLSNYWGYNPIAWCAPETGYLSRRRGANVRQELRDMVEALHAAGIEIVLDVVYNHTAEGDGFGPTLSLRGIDNALYYHLDPADRSLYLNWTGCGNAVNLDQPLVLRLAMDSLRLWVRDYGIDGFRFDLAPALARRGAAQQFAFDPHAPLLAAIAQDPLLRERLMIAEPWDIGLGGYQLGGFPPGWLEWNDRFRDTQRGFWLLGQGTRGALASRIAGSSDVFAPARRPAHSSVNFVTAHDGFTLRDLVSYSQRHNHANGEDNRDGHAHNLSVNNGVEGETDRAEVLAARAVQRRALLAMTLLSLGTPMLLAGDDIGHTQRGNNNAYCQDNAITWLHWPHADHALADYVSALLRLRRALPLLQARGWWQPEAGQSGCAPQSGPVARWLRADGQPMRDTDWNVEGAGTLQLLLAAPGGGEAALILVNAEAAAAEFTLPPSRWMLRLDSHEGLIGVDAPLQALPARCVLPPTSVWLAQADGPPTGDPIGDPPR